MKYFILYQDCIIVKGFKKSIICDTRRGEYLELKNMVIKYFIELKYFLVKSSNKHFAIKLVSLGYGYFSDGYPNLIAKPLIWYNPKKIIEIIFYVQRKEKVFNILKQIINLNIEVLQLRILEFDFKLITEILSITNESGIRSIELFIPFKKAKIDLLLVLIEKFERVQLVIFYNSPKNESYQFLNKISIIQYKKNIIDNKFCGIINENYFYGYIKDFTESLNHNSCLNRKLSIDKDGFIRNCPSMPQHFGNIKDTTLEEALNHPDFKKYWNVTKDMIAVCKDCEFRHICTDCRAYTERTHFEKDIDLSKPLKCGYNPYTGEWAEWSTNPLKQKAIEYYGMQELVKKID